MIERAYSLQNKVKRRLRYKCPAWILRQGLPRNRVTVRHPQHRHTFCGYYDRSPWSADGKHMLVCCSDAVSVVDTVLPLKIYSFDLISGDFTYIASSECWNFQQGAQQQWIDGNRIIFNGWQNDKPAAEIHSTEHERMLASIPAHIGMVNRCQQVVALYDYRPFSAFEPDYGYKSACKGKDFAESKDHLRIGVWSLDSMTELATYGPEVLDDIDRDDPESKAGVRYVQHVKFNPCGDSFLFVLRSAAASRKVPLTSLYACDRHSGRIVRLLSTEQWSRGCNHPVWASDGEVLVNLFDPTYAARKFVLIDAVTADKRVVAKQHDGVGHPTTCDMQQFILTDEYLLSKEQLLTKYHLVTGKRSVLGRFPRAKFAKGPDRCDLHPRYHTASRMAAVDHYLGEGRVVSLVGPLI